MYDRFDIEQMRLANAGSSCAVPTRARRNRLVAFIAVVFVAAALLFAMPSLAFASEDAGASPQASESQEILLSKEDNSTSANKAPDESPTPPSYTAQDAFKSTSELKAAEVDLVSGAGASSYTAGDDKASTNAKDSDEDSDSDSNQGNQDNGCSNANGDSDSNATADQNNDNDSTGDSAGASSNVTDEIATGNNQSAHPTGDSKTDDVIAAPCDGESADLAAGAATDNVGEVQQGQNTTNGSTVSPASDVTTQATSPKIYFRFQEYDSAKYGANNTDTTLTMADLINMVGITKGQDTDKIYLQSTLAFAGTANGRDSNITSWEYSTKLPSYVRYGYDNIKNWTLVYVSRGKIVVKTISTTVNFTTTHLPTSIGDGAVLFANWSPIQYPVKYYQTGDGGTNIAWNHERGSTYWDDVLPGVALVPVTSNPDSSVFTQTGENGQWHIKPEQTAQFANYSFGLTLGDKNADGATTTKTYYNFTPGSAYANGELTLGQLISLYYPQGDTYETALASVRAFNLYPAWNPTPSTEYTISFGLGSADGGKGSISGSDIKVANDGTGKITSALWTTANPSVNNSNTTDGYQVKANNWVLTYKDTSLGAKTFTSLAALYAEAIKGDAILSPVWEKIAGPFTVTFNLGTGAGNGASVSPTSASATEFTGSVSIPTPTWEGHTFSGWAATSGGSALAGIGSSINYSDLLAKINAVNSSISNSETNKSVTIYALWGEINYKYQFKSNGGGTGAYTNVGTEQSTTWNGTITLPSAPSANAGYSFVGWFTAQNGSGTKVDNGSAYKVLAGNAATTSLTFYAHFVEDVVEMKFNVASGSTGNVTLTHGGISGQSSITLYVGASTGKLYTNNGDGTYTVTASSVGAVTPAFGTYYEYKSIGWYDAAGNVLNSSNANAQNLTINTTTGVATPKQVSNVYKSGTYSIVASPKNQYYQVQHFFQSLDGTYSTTPTSTTNGTAAYGSMVQISGFTTDTTATQVAPKTDTGYTYLSTHPNTVGSITIGAGTTSNYGSNILKIYYTRNQHVVRLEWANAPSGTPAPTFSIGGTSKASGSTVGYGQTAITVAAPAAVAGYVFTGWAHATGSTSAALTAIGTTKGVTFTMPDGDVVLTGTWRPMQYQVVFQNDDRPDQKNWGSLTGGTGTGWNSSGSGTNAKFTINVARGTTILPAGRNPIGAPGTTPANANNYYFTGWEYTNAAGNKAFWGAGSTTGIVIDPSNFQVTTTGLPSGVDGIITITARWGLVRVVSYTTANPGTFAGVNATQIKDIENADGTTTTPLLSNYSYDTLAASKTNGGKDTLDTNPRNNGNPTGQVGYKFTGWIWEMTGDAGIQYLTTVQGGTTTGGHTYTYVNPTDFAALRVTCSMTFVAQWAPTQQTVKITNTGTTGTGTWTGTAPTYNSAQSKTGATFTLPATADLKRPGYSFIWMDNSGKTYNPGATYTVGTGVLKSGGNPATESDYEILIYPVFTQGKATIEYKLATGVASGAGTLSKSSETVDLSTGSPQGSVAKANAHYTFIGWFKDAACTQQITDGSWLLDDATAGNGTNLVPGKDAASALYESATYYAKFEATKYTIIFVSDDDDHIGTERGKIGTGTTSTQQLTYGTALSGKVTLTANPGYRHTGWAYKDSTGAVKTMTTGFIGGGYNNAVLGDVTLFATYDIRDDYGLTFLDPNNTSGPIHNKSNARVSWNAPVSNYLPANFNVRAGYNFTGWYFQTNPNDIMDKDILFEDAARKYAPTTGASVNALTLYAKWEPKAGFQVIYDTNGGGAAPTPLTNVKWDQTNLLAATPVRNGYSFSGWFVEDATDHANDRQALAANTYGVLADGDDTKLSVTLVAHWTQKTYQIKYLDNVGNTQLAHAGATGDTLATVLYWDSVVPTYTPTKTGSTFIGWTYGSNTVGATTKISDLAGGTDVADRYTFELRASWQGNPTYTIQYYLVNRNDDGTYTAKTTAESTTFTGYLTPGVDADAANLRGAGESSATDYWTRFSKAGYVADKTYASNVTFLNGGGIIANSGTNHVFKLYFKEKEYTITYVDEDGTPFTPAIANKTVGWNSSSLAPATAPTRPGYGSVSWNYNNTPVAGKTVAQLLGSNDSVTTLTLKAVWGQNNVTINYTIQGDAGSATVTPANETVAAATGTAAGSKVTLSKPNLYKLDGWFYSDGTGEHAVNASWITNNADGSISIKPQKEDGIYVARTYFAKVSKLSDLSYTVEHYFMKTDGTYGTTADETTPGSDLENKTINAVDKKVTKQGFTYDAAAAGSIDSIVLLTTDTTNRTLKLFYVRDSYTVEVIKAEAGKDAPSPVPSIDDADLTTGKKYMGSTQNLPTVGDHTGWTLSWKLDDGTTIPSTATTFVIPYEADGKVTLTAVWTRDKMNVSFTDYDRPATPSGFSVTANPVQVDFGKKLGSVSGWTVDSKVKETHPTDWTLVGWTVWNADHTIQLGTIANPMDWTIDQDTVFSAWWAQTLAVTYYPGDHAAAGQTSKSYTDYKSSDNSPLPSWSAKTGGNPSTDAPTAAAGYKWIGWSWTLDSATYTYYASDAPSGATNTAMPTTVDHNYAFTAIWKALERTLSFEIDGTTAWLDGDTNPTKTIDTETGATHPGNTFPVAQRAGWKLVGWKVAGTADTTAVTKDTSYTVPGIADAVIHFVPVWKVDGMYITYTVEGIGGTRDNDEDSVSAVNATAPQGSTAKADAGYDFAGWFYRDADGTEHEVDASWLTTTANGVKITPRADSGTADNYIWSEKTYYAKFVAGDTSMKIYYYLQDVDGSYDNTQSDSETVSSTTAGAHITTGQTYNMNDFTLKTFTGFVLAADNNGEATSVTVLGNGSSVLKVYFERVKNDVTYVFAGTDQPTGVTVPAGKTDVVFGSTVTNPTVTAPGFNFAWTATYVDGNGDTQNVTITNGRFTMPAGPVTVTGTWSNPVYHIVFVTNPTGVSGMPNATNTVDFDRYNSNTSSTANTISWNGTGWVPVDTTTGATVEPTLDGQKFLGWFYKNADGAWTPLTNSTSFAQLAEGGLNNGTATITGRWETSTYNVFFEKADGTRVATNDEAEWLETVGLTPVRPTETGYSFGYWYYLDNGTEVRYNGGMTYEALAAIQGILATDTASTGKGIKLIAKFVKNETFSIEVYKGQYVGGNLVATDEEIEVLGSNYQLADGSYVTITPGADGIVTVTLHGDAAQGITLPTELDLPFAPGYVYNPSVCDAIGVYDTRNGAVLKIFLAPMSDYKVNYVLVLENGTTQALTPSRTGLTWDSNNLGKSDVTTPAGTKVSGSWYYISEAGREYAYNAADTFGAVVKNLTGKNLTSRKEITLYIKAVAQAYSVLFVDETDVSEDPYKTIVEKDRYGWTASVKSDDPSDMGYNKNGYKWIGWEARTASGQTKKIMAGESAAYNTLAAFVGHTDADIDTPIVLYALWDKWQPVTIQFFIDQDGTKTKLDDVVNFGVMDQVVLTGGKYIVGKDIVDAHRPTGYKSPATMPFLIAVDGDNILEVVYTLNKGFKLNLNANNGANVAPQVVSGLGWTEQPDAKVTYEPTKMGYVLLDKPARWNTKADGSGHEFDEDATYAQIAAWIFGDALDENAILENGLTLYAQYEVAKDFEVIYDLNNNYETNTNIMTVVPDHRTPIDTELLNMHNVSWTTGGFDKSDDGELDAAPNGYEFIGWNTERNGTGLNIDNTMTYETISKYIDPKNAQKTITLYAQWKELVIEITYVVDDEARGTIDRYVDKVSAVTLKAEANGSSPGTQLHSVAKAKPGWHFVEWVLVTDGMTAKAGNTYANVLNMLRDDKSELSIDKHANDGRLYGAQYMARFERNADADIEYDPNGGTGEIDPLTNAHGSYVTLSNGSGFKLAHNTLKGWNTKPDGTGTHYALGQSNIVLPEAGMKLYAEWGVNNYSVKVNNPKDGGSVIAGSTNVTYGDTLSKDWIADRQPWADNGWTFTGWEYRMVDKETGEVITGFTTDPSELTVVGELELTPVFEGADIVDGPPRTGDDADYNFELTLAALWTVLAAAIAAMLLILVARRRRNEEAVAIAAAECEPVYGMHSVKWGDANKSFKFATCTYGAHSIRKAGERIGEQAKSSKRAQRVSKGIMSGCGAHAVASSADGHVARIVRGCEYGAHSIRKSGDGMHSVCVVSGDFREAREAAVAAVAYGAHSIHENGVATTAAFGAHTVVTAQTLEVVNSTEVFIPSVLGAHSIRENVIKAPQKAPETSSVFGSHSIRKSLESVAGAAHSASGAVLQGAHSLFEPAHAPANACPNAAFAAILGVHALRDSLKTAAERVNSYGTHSIKDFDTGIFEHIVAPQPPKKVNDLRVPLWRRKKTAQDLPVGAAGVSFGEASIGESASASAVLRAKPSIAARIAVGVPTAALAICLSVFGVGSLNGPTLAFADEGSAASAAQNSSRLAMSPGKAAFAGITTSSSSSTSSPPPQQSNSSSNSQATAQSPAQTAGSSNASTDVHTSSGSSDGPNGANSQVNYAQNASEGAQNASNEASSTNTSGTTAGSDGNNKAVLPENTASDTNSDSSAVDQNASEDRDNSSKKDSDAAQNSDDDNSDSTENDLPDGPLPTDPEGNSPVDDPSESGSYNPTFSWDDSYNASYLSTYDSNAPPLVPADFDSPPLESGTYFIQWFMDENFWLGDVDSELGFYQAPGASMPIAWEISRFSDSSSVDKYLLKIGEYYLVRVVDFYGDYSLSLSTDISLEDLSYWTIASKEYGDRSGCVISDPEMTMYLRANYTSYDFDDATVTLRPTTNPSSEYFLWLFSQPQPCDWEIDYFPNGATADGSTPTTKVSAVDGATISECNYKRYGYTFVEWNTADDGSGTSYVPGEYVYGGGVMTSDFILKLYAIWMETFANITFSTSGNGAVYLGGTGEATDTVTQMVSSSTGLIQGSLENGVEGVAAKADKGYHFSSWLIEGGIGEIPESLRYLATLTADDITSLSKFKDPEFGWVIYHDMTLVADFVTNTYKINYDANGGSGSMAARSVNYGDDAVITKPEALTRTRYVFKGWNTKADGSGISVSDAETLERLLAAGVIADENGSAATLYAQWEEQPAGSIDQGGSNNGVSNFGSSNGTVTNTNAGFGNASGSYQAGTYRGYRYSNDSTVEMTPEVAAEEAALDVEPVVSEKITTQAPKGGFLSSAVGMAVAVVAAVAVAAAVIAGIVAFATSGGAGAAGAAAASEGGFFSRLRRRVFGPRGK